MSTNTILVPLDGSKFSEWAVPIALGLAKGLDGQVELLSAFEEEPRVGGWLISTAGAKEWFDDYHQDLLERIAGQSNVMVSSTVVHGPVPKVLEEYVERNRPELVVMSTHGRGPMSRAWLGSVADRLVRHVTEPVLLVRPQEEDVELREADAFCRILIPLDGSQRAEQSIPWALKMGHDRCASYTLIRAVPPLFPLTSSYLPHAVKETKEILEHGRQESEAYIKSVQQRLQAEELAVEAEVVVGVQPGWGIVRYAEEHDQDLIVIGTHGRGGLTRILLGSVADKVVRAATVPVLVHRPVDV